MLYYRVLEGEVKELEAETVSESQSGKHIIIDGSKFLKSRKGAFFCLSKPVADSMAIHWLNEKIEFHEEILNKYNELLKLAQ